MTSNRSSELTAENATDVLWLRKAIELSRRCPQTEQSFAVGAILVATDGGELASGFSLELGAGWHAEEVAISKARERGCSMQHSTLYCSLEPCSVRLSGKTPCITHILDAGIECVVFAWHEPLHFVECRGEELLREKGIEVRCVPQLAALVEEINKHVLAGKR